MKKTAIISSIIGVTTLIGGGYTLYSTIPIDEFIKANDEIVKSKIIEPTITLKEETKVEEEIQPVVSEPTVEQTETPPVVLSTQEYGEQYLDLSGENQTCFDKIIATWPDRFTESVRENNVKALKIWANVCATGIQRNRSGAIFTYGMNGEFFDSEVAKSFHN